MKHPENDKEYKGLTVNAGVENLPSVNPYATFRRRRGTMPGLLNKIFFPFIVILPDWLLGCFYRMAKNHLMKV
mgnify:CR=1 FL=1